MSEEVVIDVELGGVKRRLALDLNASIALAAAGQDITAIAKELSREDASLGAKMRATRTMLWAMMSSEHPEFEADPIGTQHLVGSWLSINDLARVGPELGRLVTAHVEELGASSLREFEGQMAPYVPTPDAVVEAMIDAAGITDGALVVDLGAGDGRLLFRAVEKAERVTAVGYELHEERYARLLSLVKSHWCDRIKVMRQDLRQADVSQASVVFLYLFPQANAELQSKLRAECQPGTRIVSHDFPMPDWPAETERRVRSADRDHVVYTWTV